MPLAAREASRAPNLSNNDEILTVRSLIDRFVVPRRPGESTDLLIARQKDMIDTWLTRPQLAMETDDEYRIRIGVYDRICNSLPAINNEDRQRDHQPLPPRTVNFDPPPPALSHTVHRSEVINPTISLPLRSTPHREPSIPTFRASVPTRLSSARDLSETSDCINRHQDQARNLLDQLISENVDQPPDDRAVADVLRKAKLPMPDPYSGKPSAEIFQKWVADFVSWLAHNNIVGPEFDRKRVQLVGANVTDAAATWYYTEVTSPEREVTNWDFRSLIHAMHARFVPRSTRLQAIEDFERCRYSSSDGAQGFWSRLRVIAVRLPSQPDAYTLAKRFLSGLPKEIFDLITLTRGLSAEYSTSAELVDAAEDAENSLRVVRAHDNQIQNRRPASTGTHMQDNGSHTNKRRDKQPRPPHSSSRDKPRESNRPHESDRLQTSRPPANRPANKPPASAFNSATAQCFACGAYGHIASDPKCPKYTQRMHLALTGSDDISGAPNDTANASDDHIEPDPTSGSQRDDGSDQDSRSTSSSDSDDPARGYPDWDSSSSSWDDDDNAEPRISGMQTRLGMTTLDPKHAKKSKKPAKGSGDGQLHMYDAKMRRKLAPNMLGQPLCSAESQQLIIILTDVTAQNQAYVSP